MHIPPHFDAEPNKANRAFWNKIFHCKTFSNVFVVKQSNTKEFPDSSDLTQRLTLKLEYNAGTVMSRISIHISSVRNIPQSTSSVPLSSMHPQALPSAVRVNYSPGTMGVPPTVVLVCFDESAVRLSSTVSLRGPSQIQ